MLELNKIGLLTEFSNLDIYIDNSFNPPTSLEYEVSVDEQIQELKLKYFPKDIEKSAELGKKWEKTAELEGDGVAKYKRKNEFPKILSEIEQLNVDVPMNRNKFRQFYLKSIREYMKKEEDVNWQSKGEGGYLDVDEPSSLMPVNPHPLTAISFQKIK